MLKRNLCLLLTILTLMVVATACGGAQTPAPEEAAPATEAVAPAEEEAAPAAEEAAPAEEEAAPATEEVAPAEEEAATTDTGEGSFLERAEAGEFKGTEVTWVGVMVGEEIPKVEASLKPFEDATGIDVKYEGTKEFEATINVRVDAGDAPDIVDFPQPGLLANLVRDGKVVDVSTFLDENKLKENYNQSWLDMATMEGPDGPIMAGVWHRAAQKSIIWYPKAQFEAAGYEIPQTWDDLVALTQTIADDGDTAWCIGLESGAATGWVATDWMENVMLRTTSLENYDKWVTGELPFSSPEVKRAAEVMSEIWLNEDYVNGGTAGIVSTFIGDAPKPMFEDPPKCWLHAQASWITDFFGEGLESGVDYDFFYMPPIDEAYGKPVLVAGDINAMFNDRPEVRALMEYFSTGASVEEWIKLGGAISPHNDSSLDWYTTDIDRGVAQIILEADSLRFDASDLMPGEVGAGSFWKGMTDYISGASDLDTALQEIDESWPDQGAAPAAEEPAEEATAEATEEAAAADSGTGEGSFLERAEAGEFKGTEVTWVGVMVGEEIPKVEASLKPFEDATGIDVKYEGTKEFEATINVRVDAGDAPDIVDFPQPGLLANLVRDGKVVDVSTFLDENKLKENYNQSWLDMATMEGPDGPIMAGVWHRAAQKSIIWYPKAQFEAAGYEIPQTWDDLVALTQTIADDGDTAWCIGLESGAATGWVATDWMENVMLRTTSLENYDKWVTGELPFSSPEVKRAAEVMSEIWLNEDYVNGGTAGIVSTFIGDAPKPMFEDPPKCWLHAQASWITDFFGEGLESGVDYDFFYMPPIDEAYGKPVLVAGDINAMFNDRPEVRALMEYFSTGASVEEWIKLGGAISPHNDSSLDWYTTDIDRGVAQIILEADSLRFDASDLMPGEVGAGSFWKGMTDYISGASDLDTALQEIDESWPE